MVVNKIDYDEKLRSGTDKINQSIEQSNQAIDKANSADTKADSAVTTANTANTKSDDTQQQLNNIVINNGQSDAEVLQARGSYSVLNERLSATDDYLSVIDQEKADKSFVDKTHENEYHLSVHGGIADKITDNTPMIQTLADTINTNGGGILYIPYGCKWDYRSFIHPNEVIIHDHSGYEWKYDNWTGQIKYFVQTSDPQLKNAHEMIFASNYHPAVVVDNITADGETNRMASFVWRENNAPKWLATALYDQGLFTVRSFPKDERLFSIHEDSRIGFGGDVATGIAFNVKTKLPGTMISKFNNNDSTKGHSFQLTNPTGILFRLDVDETGSISAISKSGSPWLRVDPDGSIKGTKKAVYPKTNSYSIPSSETSATYTNEGAIGGFIITLPAAERGMEYSFVVVTSQNMRVELQNADSFRGLTAGKYKESSAAGTSMTVRCVQTGIWDIMSSNGTWTNEA